MLLRFVRFVLGLVLGVGLWVATASLYNGVVARGTGTLLRFDGRLADAKVTAGKARMTILSPGGSFPTTVLPVAQLTYNAILLIALFASNDRPWRRANLQALLVSLLVIAALHPVGSAVSAESTYANRMGRWSEEHYSDFAAGAWHIAEMFYRLVGMFGAVFACWWISSQAASTHPNPVAGSGRKRGRNGGRSRA